MKNKHTANLWFQYLEMVTILQTFIKAEQTGNWALHMRAMKDMLPYLAGSGHNNYAKFVYLYLQNMNKLQRNHPNVYRHFQEGLHVARRSSRYYAGQPDD